MNGLNVFQYDGADVVDSREVARMVDKQHKNLLADIRGYINAMEEANNDILGPGVNGLKIQPVEFFIASSYLDDKGETRPCYLITKKGCDMIANKLTGKKGVLFTAAYVTAFEQMRDQLTAMQPHPVPAVSPGALASLITTNRRVMLDMGATVYDVGRMVRDTYGLWNIPSPEFYKRIPGQASLFDGGQMELGAAAE